MGGHPANLGLRFLLELTALASAGYWGWLYFDGPIRIVAAVALPIMAAILWGTFAVPDDPSRSGGAPIAVPGLLRLALELAILTLPALGLYLIGARQFSLVFVAVVLVHYMLSYDRIMWLIGR